MIPPSGSNGNLQEAVLFPASSHAVPPGNYRESGSINPGRKAP